LRTQISQAWEKDERLVVSYVRTLRNRKRENIRFELTPQKGRKGGGIRQAALYLVKL
jgi:hypothetical protein